MDPWIAEAAERIAARAPEELARLVMVSSPSGDVDGAEASLALAVALAPEEIRVERLPCSSADHAEDLILTLTGTGRGRIVLVGHVDTVISHDDHRPLEDGGERLTGSGSFDMKGGVLLALGVLRELAERPQAFDEIALLLVCDEEHRVGDFVHAERFAGYDACLCFEGAELTADGDEAVVVRRKAAGTLQVLAHGRAAHSGSAPDKGINALLALASAAQLVAALHDPGGPARLTAVPTVIRSGEAFNATPAAGTLLCDLRADDPATFDDVLAGLPAAVDGVDMEYELVRCRPGMDARVSTAPLLQAAGARLGRPIVGIDRGGFSDASSLASVIAITIDGLGPRGGDSHSPVEFVYQTSLRSRAEVALAIVDAVLERDVEMP
jgi:glutamate carboxypeptidase